MRPRHRLTDLERDLAPDRFDRHFFADHQDLADQNLRALARANQQRECRRRSPPTQLSPSLEEPATLVRARRPSTRFLKPKGYLVSRACVRAGPLPSPSDAHRGRNQSSSQCPAPFDDVRMDDDAAFGRIGDNDLFKFRFQRHQVISADLELALDHPSAAITRSGRTRRSTPSTQ